MTYSLKQYQEIARRFNEKTFLAKVILIKQQTELFSLESDGVNFKLRLLDFEAMNQNIDALFDFPETLNFQQMRDIFSLADINIRNYE